MLPDGDGVALVRRLRQLANATPVLMLTAVGDIDARVEGIEAVPTITSSSPSPSWN